MIERMFDSISPTPVDHASVIERLLDDWLAAGVPADIDLVRPRRTVMVDAEPHGDPAIRLARLSAEPQAVASAPENGAGGAESSGADPQTGASEPGSVGVEQGGDAVDPDPVEPELTAFAGLLESGAAHLERAREAQQAQSRKAAVLARALAAFAAARPAGTLDRPATEIGAAAAASRAARPAVLTPVSEWAVDELMVALSLSSPAASALLSESVTLVAQLPATLAALEAGELTWAHARVLTEVLAPIADDTLRAHVEARVLARAAGKTVSALRVAARRAVLRADADVAARRLAAAVRDRSVRVHPGRDGMASLTATLPLPVARACLRMLEAYAADSAAPGDRRTKEQRVADCLADLLLRPDAAGRPPVQAQLTVVASVDTLTGGDEPGEVDGQPVPAALVRELAYTLGLLPRPGEPGPDDTQPDVKQPEDTRSDAASSEDTAAADTAVEDAATADAEAEDAEPEYARAAAADQPAAASGLADLLRLRSAAGTALAEPPQVAIVDELSGQLLALASPTEIRRAASCTRPACRTGGTPCTHPPAGSGLGPPPATDGYRPTDAQQRFLRARDRRCRFPGCRTPAARCDLDHNDPYPAGATSCDNLCCLCRHHHRLSHQAPGWTMHRLPDGGLEWTTPSGDRITTHPPRYGTDDDLPRTPPPTLRERMLGRPATPEEKADDPAPF